MKTEEDSIDLAHAMVKIGNHVGRQTMAVISDMSEPLGFAIGNALEVKEAIDTLKGNGPEDLTELVLTLGSQMVMLAKKAESTEDARKQLLEVIQNGKAIEKFKEFIAAQGGDPSVVDHPEKLPQATFQIPVPAKADGVVAGITADEIGKAATMLGAGRATKDDVIDLAVGIILHKKIGDSVKKGDTLLTIHSNHQQVDEVVAKIYDHITIADYTEKPKLIHRIIAD